MFGLPPGPPVGCNDIFAGVDKQYNLTSRVWANFDDVQGTSPISRILVAAVEATETEVAHWLYVSMGFTHLTGPRRQVNGHGFEIIFRVRMMPEELAQYEALRKENRLISGAEEFMDIVPSWPMNVIDGLGRYLKMSGLTFRPYESLRLGQPGLCLAGAILAVDPILSADVDTPRGEFLFYHLVGVVHPDEYDMIWQWSSRGVYDIMIEADRLQICDVEKPSLLTNEAIKKEIDRRVGLEGSQLRNVAAPTNLDWTKQSNGYLVSVDMLAMARVKLLERRLPFRRVMSIRGRDRIVLFTPADGVHDDTIGIHPLPESIVNPKTNVLSFELTVDDDSETPCLVITLSADKVKELADSLSPEPSKCSISVGDLTLSVEVTYAD